MVPSAFLHFWLVVVPSNAKHTWSVVFTYPYLSATALLTLPISLQQWSVLSVTVHLASAGVLQPQSALFFSPMTLLVLSAHLQLWVPESGTQVGSVSDLRAHASVAPVFCAVPSAFLHFVASRALHVASVSLFHCWGAALLSPTR